MYFYVPFDAPGYVKRSSPSEQDKRIYRRNELRVFRFAPTMILEFDYSEQGIVKQHPVDPGTVGYQFIIDAIACALPKRGRN